MNGNGAQPQAQPAPAAAPAEPAPPQPEAPQPQMNREPAQAPAPQAPQGIAPQSPVVAQDPTGMDQYYKTAVGGIGQQQQGIQQEAQALGKQSQAEAQVAEQGIQQQQKSLEDYQNHFNDLQQKRTALAQDYANGHIDTSRYVNNMSTGQKVLTAIGLILGGYSGDGTDFIDKQINRDIEAQKVDMDKKHNLLSANMQEFGNLHDATDMARVYQADMYSKQLFAAAQKTNDPIIKARALQQAGALQTNIAAPLMQQVAQRRWLMGIGQGQAQTGEDMQDRSAEQTLNALRVVTRACKGNGRALCSGCGICVH